MKNNLKKKKYNTIIIGLGSVGMGYKHDNIIFSHSQSVQRHKKFNLLAGIDIKKRNREVFSKKFKKPAFQDLSNFKGFKIDVVIISCPEQQHLKILLQIIKKLNVKLILIEKPCGTNYMETKKILNICKFNKIKVLVNYQRNYNKSFDEIIKILKNKKLKGFFWYSKQIRNNCSHFINFLLRLSKQSFKIKNVGSKNKGNFILYNDQVYINFLKTIEKKKIINECDLISNNYRITSKNDFNDFNIFSSQKSNFFKNYSEYSERGKLLFTNYKKTQFQILDNIVKIFEKNKKIDFDRFNIETSLVLDKIQKILK